VSDEAKRAQAIAKAEASGLVGMGAFDEETGEFEWYEGPPLGVVVGRNVKRLRTERALTQHELAQLWRRHGLNWARSKLAALETGSRPQISVGELVLMGFAMRVPLAEFFAGPQGSRVSLAPYEADFDAAELSSLFAPELPNIEITLSGDAWQAQRAHMDSVLVGETPAQADVELAQRLGLPPEAVVRAAIGLFDGLTLTQERDRRVERMGSHSMQERQAHRGHITRELSVLVEKALSEEVAP